MPIPRAGVKKKTKQLRYQSIGLHAQFFALIPQICLRHELFILWHRCTEIVNFTRSYWENIFSWIIISPPKSCNIAKTCKYQYFCDRLSADSMCGSAYYIYNFRFRREQLFISNCTLPQKSPSIM